MPDLESKIFTALSTAPGVSALVADRIYPLVLPQKCIFPALSYFRVSGRQINDIGGATGVENPRIQVDCWAESYRQAKALALAAKTAFLAATAFKALVLSDQDLVDGEKPILYRVSIDFSCWHKED